MQRASRQNQIVTVFGGTGFLGTYVVRELAKAGYLVRAVSRNPEQGLEAKTAGIVGQVVLQKGDIRSVESVEECVHHAYAVVNLTGVLFEKGQQNFSAIHAQGAERIAKAAKAAKVEHLVHVSALGIDRAVKSKYARTKITGEKAVVSAFPRAVILRPSVIFGPEDNFFGMFARLASFLPALPLIGGGKTKFQPVYVADVARAVVASIAHPEAAGKLYELGGPGVYTFRELMAFLLKETGLKRRLIPIPFGLASILGIFGEFMPNPMLTRDQVTLLQYDNVMSPNARTLKDLGITPTSIEAVVPAYLARFAKQKLEGIIVS